jgi:hypothetical protein
MDIQDKNPFTFIDDAISVSRIIPNQLYTCPANTIAIVYAQTFDIAFPENEDAEYTLEAGDSIGNDLYFYYVREYKILTLLNL